MILSVSRRTDIPCFYSEWLMNRVAAGYAITRNPMNPAQLFRVPIAPETTEGIVFWTKDPLPLLPRLDELERRGFVYYFQFTITPYDRCLEPGLRGKSDILHTFIDLSRCLGKARLVWRYDPILLTEQLTPAWHVVAFARMCERLAPYTEEVTISFVDEYRKIKNPPWRAPKGEEGSELATALAATAHAAGLRISACCESAELQACGLERAACVSVERLVRCGAQGENLRIPRDRNQRPGCGCAASVDIGAYDSCGNGCRYCYALRSAAAQACLARHDPHGELLVGGVREEERAGIRERRL